MRNVLLVLGVLLAAGCGKGLSTDPVTGPDVKIESLSVKYVPGNHVVWVTGMLRRASNGEREFFYIRGNLGDSAPIGRLASPDAFSFHCLEQPCRKFEFPLKRQRLGIDGNIVVTLHALDSYQNGATKVAATASAKYNFSASWQKLLTAGLDPTKSALAQATNGRDVFYGIFLAGKPGAQGKREWAHLAGRYEEKTVVANFYHHEANGPVSSVGNETGKVSRTSDRELRIEVGGTSISAAFKP